jgi:hypothetical protein
MKMRDPQTGRNRRGNPDLALVRGFDQEFFGAISSSSSRRLHQKDRVVETSRDGKGSVSHYGELVDAAKLLMSRVIN